MLLVLPIAYYVVLCERLLSHGVRVEKFIPNVFDLFGFFENILVLFSV